VRDFKTEIRTLQCVADHVVHPPAPAHLLAIAVALPELMPLLPPKPRPYAPERERMNIFDAAGLAFVGAVVAVSR
jgi:hypothetical protein